MTVNGRLPNPVTFAVHMLALFFALALAVGCTSLKLVEDYDPQIEQSLNDYHKSLISFVTRMERAAGTEAGSYAGGDATEFYSTSAGELANLVVKATARNPQGRCAVSSPIAKGISGVLLQSSTFFGSNGNQPSATQELGDEVNQALEEFNNGTSDLAVGSCTVVILKALKLNHQIFESIHKRKTWLKPPVSTIATELISDTVQMAIIAEQSKKP